MKKTGIELPKGWIKVHLNEFTRIEMGQSPASESYNFEAEGLPFFQGKAEFGNIHPAVKKYCNNPKKIAQTGAILLSVRAPVGPTNIAFETSCIGRGLAAIHPLGSMSSYFLLYMFRSLEPTLSQEGTGSTFKAINKQQLQNLEFLIPPLPEQHRIVAKIEALFSELESGVKSLKEARAQLKRYRQSVLKAAFEGRLTETWRAEHADTLESADSLLERIRSEREAAYERKLAEWSEAIAAWEAAGKEGKKPAKPKKPKELPLLSNEDKNKLSSIPTKWQWIRAGELFEFVTSGSRGWAKYYADTGAIFVRITNLDFHTLKPDFSTKKIQYVQPPKNTEGSRTKVQKNDFLFSITGYLGMFAIAPELKEAYVNQHIALARPLPGYSYEYFGHYVTSTYGGLKYLNLLQKGAVKAGLRLDDINEFPVPLCSVEEQHQIVNEIESCLSQADAMETAIDESLKKSEALRQSILKKAFEGRLVPQDPDDEPASELLKRIKKEKG